MPLPVDHNVGPGPRACGGAQVWDLDRSGGYSVVDQVAPDGWRLIRLEYRRLWRDSMLRTSAPARSFSAFNGGPFSFLAQGTGGTGTFNFAANGAGRVAPYLGWGTNGSAETGLEADLLGRQGGPTLASVETYDDTGSNVKATQAVAIQNGVSVQTLRELASYSGLAENSTSGTQRICLADRTVVADRVVLALQFVTPNYVWSF